MAKDKGKNKKELTRKEINTSVVDLDKKLANLPYTSDEYMKVLDKIRKKEKDIYGDQHILCVRANDLKDLGIKTTILDDQKYKVLCMDLLLNDFSELNMRSGFYPRYMVEHDYRYKQVLTFAYITNNDRTEFILLRKNDSNRLGMVGGHTDFSIDAYNDKPEDFLIQNLYKELFEEIKITDANGERIDTAEALNVVPEFKMLINENDDHYKLRNIGFIYEIKLPVDHFEENYTFKSGEPTIHDIEHAKYQDIIESTRYHSMLKYIPQIFEAEKKE